MLRDRPHVVVEVLLELEDLLERPAGLRRVEKRAVYRSVQVAVVCHSLLERIQHPLLHVQERAVLRRDVLDEAVASVLLEDARDFQNGRLDVVDRAQAQR